MKKQNFYEIICVGMRLEKGALAGGSSDKNYNLSLVIVAIACLRLYWMIEFADSVDFAN